jgi:hypothetical protein
MDDAPVQEDGPSRSYRECFVLIGWVARLNFAQLRDQMLASGQLTTQQLDADVARLVDEEYEWRSPIFWTAWGQRPSNEAR